MTQETITPEKIDALLAFLPGFERPNRTFVREWLNDRYPIYDEDVEAFFKLASEACWLDYNYQPAVAGKLLYDDAAIAQADLDTLKTLLTYCVRGERFSDGLRATLLEHGRVQALLRRLQLLRNKGDLFSKNAVEIWFMRWQFETLNSWNYVTGFAELLQSEQLGPLTNEQKEVLDRLRHHCQLARDQWFERNRIAKNLFSHPVDENPLERP